VIEQRSSAVANLKLPRIQDQKVSGNRGIGRRQPVIEADINCQFLADELMPCGVHRAEVSRIPAALWVPPHAVAVARCA